MIRGGGIKPARDFFKHFQFFSLTFFLDLRIFIEYVIVCVTVPDVHRGCTGFDGCGRGLELQVRLPVL